MFTGNGLRENNHQGTPGEARHEGPSGDHFGVRNSITHPDGNLNGMAFAVPGEMPALLAKTCEKGKEGEGLGRAREGT